MSITEIESAIAQFPAKDFAELMLWLQKHCDRVWNQRIEEDLASGRLDAIMNEAENEYRQGFAKPR